MILQRYFISVRAIILREISHWMHSIGPQSFDNFMAEFGDNAIMPQNGNPRIMFEQNVNFINAMNALFVQQEVSFSMEVNQFSALSFQEFALRQSGMGVFDNQFDARPEFDNRGVLGYKYELQIIKLTLCSL